MITYLHHRAPSAGPDRVLLIMLPGVGIEAAEFAEHGMVAAVHAHGLAVDIAAVHPGLELYRRTSKAWSGGVRQFLRQLPRPDHGRRPGCAAAQ